jgi:hypothetical protein
MIDYKYPTIASGATPIGSAGCAPDEGLLREDHQWRIRKKIRVHELDIYSHRERGFKNPTILVIAFEVEDIWSRRLKKSKIEDVKDWSLETQPESATQVESRGLLTWICPLGTRRLVYRVWPIKKVDQHKDSKMTWRQRRKVLIRIRLGHCKL